MIMQEEQIREALNKHWQASAVGDANAEHDIYADDAICDYPQSGERILGRSNLQALRSHHPGKQVSASSEFSEKVTSGSRNIRSPIRDGQHTQ
jgi:ketosteroid isomerase-like protein